MITIKLIVCKTGSLRCASFKTKLVLVHIIIVNAEVKAGACLRGAVVWAVMCIICIPGWGFLVSRSLRALLHILVQVQEQTSKTAGSKALAISLGHFGAYVWTGVWGCLTERKANEGKSYSIKVDTSRGLGLASGMGKSPPSQCERKMGSGWGYGRVGVCISRGQMAQSERRADGSWWLIAAFLGCWKKGAVALLLSSGWACSKVAALSWPCNLH